MAAANTYTVTTTITPGAAINVFLEIAAPATKPLELFDLEITQHGTTVSAALAVLFRLATGATTVWTPTTLTPGKNNPSDGAAASTVKAWASGTSTDGTGAATFRQSGFNILNGYLHNPVPESRIQVAAATFLVFKWAIAPPAAVAFDINCTFREIG